MLCPYYVGTSLLPTEARFMPVDSATGKPEHVVEACTRLMADTRIVGRALVVGPKVKTRLDDEGMVIPELSEDEKETAVWEAYADDFEQVDAFTAGFIKMLNLV